MAIYALDGLTPQVADTAWVADNAQVMGEVSLAAHSSVWCSVLHADHGMPLTIGRHVTVGHQVMLHGCTIGDESLIGIGAVVLNGAKIGKHCLVGAGALVTEGKEFPDGSMILGSPARVVKTLSPEQIEGLRQSAQHYIDNARRFRQGLKKIA